MKFGIRPILQATAPRRMASRENGLGIIEDLKSSFLHRRVIDWCNPIGGLNFEKN
jgi:hypothetical protein